MKNDKILNIKRGKRLKACREAAGLTQEELSEKSNYSIQTISYIENGKRGLTTDSAYTFGKCLNIRMEYLLCDDDHKTTSDMYKYLKSFNRKERNIQESIAENNYIFLDIPGKNEVVYHDSNIQNDVTIVNVEKYVLYTPDNKFLTCTEEQYIDLIGEIDDFISMKLKRFENSCIPATEDEINKFTKFYNFE